MGYDAENSAPHARARAAKKLALTNYKARKKGRSTERPQFSFKKTQSLSHPKY
jgi:hypothetical protein